MVKSKPSMTAAVSREAVVDTSYFTRHRPPGPDEAADPDEPAVFAYKITTDDGGVFPNDMLDHPEFYLEDARREDVKETVAALRRIQGDPDAVVTIYRGAPGDYVNTGDWVTLSRSYAEEYTGGSFYSGGPDSRLLSIEAKASELTWSGDSWFEFGYWGKRKKSR